MPAGLRHAAQANPVSYAVDLMRAALGQPAEFAAPRSIIVLITTTVSAFFLTMLIFDPEHRFTLRDRPARR
jgi:hypothetical protein